MARIAQEVRRAYAACAAALVSGGVDLDAIDALGLNVEMPVFTVSQAAQIAGVHPQTLAPVRPPWSGGASAHGGWCAALHAS